jgi:predicted nucleotidyltransferase
MKTLAPDLLAEITQRLVDEFQPEQIFLFGSRAWGVPTEDSDIDLLVILPGEARPTTRDVVRARRCLSGLKVAKDILVRSRAQVERFRRVPASLERQILEQGKLLYGRG